jgi:predicted RNase H-like HicB family nuclease
MVVQKLSEDDGGGYLAFALDLKGCIADGETPEAAIADLREAIKEWLDEAKRLERDIPEPGSALVRAAKERAEMVNVIKKQSELIASLSSMHETLEDLRGQIADLAEASDNSSDLGPLGDFGVVVGLRADDCKNGVQH